MHHFDALNSEIFYVIHTEAFYDVLSIANLKHDAIILSSANVSIGGEIDISQGITNWIGQIKSFLSNVITRISIVSVKSEGQKLRASRNEMDKSPGVNIDPPHKLP